MYAPVKFALVLFIGALLGIAATWFVVFVRGMPGGVSDGVWRTNAAIGSSGGDIYTRASVAVHGLLALNGSETIYYTATTDGAGGMLDGACSYHLTGHDPDARWWSITAYGADDYLIPGTDGHYSVSKNSILRKDDGSFAATVSQAPAGANWIAVRPGRFSLTLRLYNPGARVTADREHAMLPTLTKIGCR
jgi:hypothetical protein